MDAFDKKVLSAFPGKAVRKDLTALMKKGANVPTYVLEYLLAGNCTTDDEEAIRSGMERIRKILSENYVKPDQSELIKSRIKEKGVYTIIDKLTVELDEHEDIYDARFTNLKIDPFKVSDDFVVHNEKLLTGGVWCIVKIAYIGLENSEEEIETEIFGGNQQKQKKRRKKRSRYDSPFEIVSLKPIQLAGLDLDEFFEVRKQFSDQEWIILLLRSAGYEPTELSERQQMHYLLRLVPFIQKNYNLVELGPRGTGKSHCYSELSPYSILMSSGHTTVSNLFYHMGRRRVGLVGNWDCVAFDEVGGITESGGDMVQMLKNYMANGSFARGTDAINADASIAFEGNTFRSVSEMLRTSHLFEPFPNEFSNDSAFFDRIHAYLPGWETPKLRSSLFTEQYGLLTDCLSEFCHIMRRYDYTDCFGKYFALGRQFNARDDIAVRRTFSGFCKLLYPDGEPTKEQARGILIYAIECRRRVKEQLRRMNPSEFGDVALSYIDLEDGSEHIIQLPEAADGTLIPDVFEEPGYVYAGGRALNGKTGIYRLENRLISGRGNFSSRNIEGLSRAGSSVHDSLQAAFVYFREHVQAITSRNEECFDYALYFNDLQSCGASDELSVAQAVALFSAITGRSVKPAALICGRVMMSGSVMPPTADLGELMAAACSAGAKTILLPSDCASAFDSLPDAVKNDIQAMFYRTPLEAARIALEVN